MHTRLFTRRLLGCGVFALLLAPLPAAEIISNGSFESGLTGWTTANAPGGDGSFFSQTGTLSPVNSSAVPAPPSGARAAMTDAQGPGSHVLYQDFTVTAPVGSAVLSFASFIGNQAGAFFVPSPNTLDFGVAAFNQQARVDILRATAAPFSVAGPDILMNVFQTSPGSSAGAGYTVRSVDLTPLLNANLNTLLRLRFSEVDNVSTLQFGVDNVSLQTSAVPEPSSVLLGGFGLLLLCLVLPKIRQVV